MRKNKLLATLILLLLTAVAYAQVTADFTANSTEGCGSLQVSFTDQSSSTAGPITNWSWNLGGVNSTNQNPGRIFGTPGSYTICLTATDSEGNTDTECKNNLIRVFNLPEPSFTVDSQFGCVPAEITFTNTSTSVDGTITEYIWGLGGSTGVVIDDGSMPVLTNTYEQADEFTISLTVTDDNGCVNSITQSNFITTYNPPEINVTITDTFDCNAPFIVTPINNAPDPALVYIWDYGNGLPLYVGANPPGTVYTQEGYYTITVIAQNPQTSCADTLVMQDIINVGEATSFTFDTTVICQGESIAFTNTSIPGVSNFQWDFGDGGSASSTNASHVFDTPGCFTVSLSGDFDGCTDIFSTTGCIQVLPNPTVNFLMDEPDGCSLPHVVNFNGFSNNGIDFTWDFGDGSTSILQNPTHVFNQFGVYPVTLEVVNANGCSQSFTDTVKLIETMASMDLDVVFGCSPVSFSLSDNSTTVSPITDWFWSIDTAFSFPNSPVLTSSSPSPSFSIADTGWYDITLIVTNSFGCTDTIINSNAIGVGIPPVIDFEAIPLVACVDEPVQFIDLSSSYADAWFWNFGDGVASEEQNPEHPYTMPDTFDVSLIVAHNGCDTFLSFSDYIIVQEPLANFTISRDCGNPYEISYTDASIGADSIFWDFGLDPVSPNDTSSLLNPVIVYPDTGCYITTLFAFNDSTLCIDTLTQNICIADPLASFNVGPLVGCVPLVVNIENNSLFDVAWEWSAPGGVVSNPNAESPSITYNTPGLYSNIELVVTDVNGCRDSIMFNEMILADGVDAQINAVPQGGCSPLMVDFLNNSVSFDSPIQSYQWEISNPDSIFMTTDEETSFFFDTVGVYPVTLTVTNERGCTNTDSYEVNVSNPTIMFTADTISCPSDTIQFTNLSTGDNLQFFWTFGDGDTSTLKNPGHPFSAVGTYEVCLEIIDDANCNLSQCQLIDIVNPVAGFSIDSTFANCPPLVATFTNESLNGIFYQWDFGDSSGISNLVNPAHVYTVPGIYDVQLIAIINDNCTDTLRIDSLVTLQGPVGDFSFDIDTTCVGYAVTFFGSSELPYTYIWDFGNGDLDTTLAVTTDTISYIYPEAGVYVPKLILVDENDCSRGLESADSIYVALLSLDFVATDSTLCEGIDQTTFLNLTNSSAPILNLEWFFENGAPTSSTAFEPTVSFPTIGNFDIWLTVDNGYCSDTLFKDDYIGAGPIPNADFIASGTGGCAPYGIQLTDQSTVVSGTIENYFWSFGGLGVLNEPNPYYVYTTGGEFEVQLVIETEFGCRDTATLDISVSEPADPFLSVGKDEICIGDALQIEVEFQDDTTGLEYFWLADPTLSCTDCLEPIASPIVSTDYFFVTSTSSNCLDTASITVNVGPNAIPDISLTSDTIICFADILQIDLNSDGIADTYDWDSSADGLSCYDCDDPIATPLTGTLYTVTVTNSFGCDVVDSIFVDVVDQNQPLTSGDRTICQGDTVQLDLLVDGIPTWFNSNGLSCDDCNNPLASPSETQVYPIQTITSDFGCLLMDTLVLTVYDLDALDAGTDDLICAGELFSLNATVTEAGALQWTPSASLSVDTIRNPVASPAETTTYYLTLDQDLCQLRDSVTITVQYETDVSGTDYIICAGDTIVLQPIGLADTFDWTPEESLSNATAETPLAFPMESTTYILEASLTTCIEDTAEFNVTVNQGPTIDVPFSYDKYPGVDVQIDVEIIAGNGSYTYEWIGFSGLTCSDCPNPLVTADTSGFYTLIVRDEINGCETEQQVFINKLRTCNPDLLGVPNIFTPNGDSYNEQIHVYTGTIPGIESFRIFNRWGALVFETDNIDEGWDGLYKGEKMPTGVYVFVIEATCPLDGSTFIKQGEFTLMR
jgi:gliding motility-associated-like protein